MNEPKRLVGKDGTRNISGEEIIIDSGDYLSVRAVELNDSVKNLTSVVLSLVNKQRNQAVAGVFLFILIILISLAGLFIYQQKKSTELGICQLNSLILESRNNISRDSYPLGPLEYDRSFERIEQISRDLECS